jgi:hypothetical protein
VARPLVLLGLLALTVWSGCMGPQSPASRASEAARELNVNSRFGDVAGTATMTSPNVRAQYVSRRAEWGKLERVVDVDLGGFQMTDAEHATVIVDFQWTRVDDGTLHNTRVLQEWASTEGPWMLVRERRQSGDIGLFGEAIAPTSAAPRPDVQFPTRVIN